MSFQLETQPNCFFFDKEITATIKGIECNDVGVSNALFLGLFGEESGVGMGIDVLIK